MAFFQKIDLYGSRLTFLLNGKSKYTTSVGGIMTILSFIIIIILTFIFGQDVIFKRNPSVTMSGFTASEHKTMKFGDQHIFMPWRIEDVHGIKVNFESYLFPRIVYYVSEREGDNDFNLGTEYTINYTKCDKETLNATNLALGEYYCSDWNNLEMGGGWEGSFIKYIKLELFLCPHGQNYTSDANCTDLNILESIFNSENPWYFLMYYPRIEFSPNDIENPFKISYMSYFYSLSNILVKIDRFYYKETVLNDDQGWIFETSNNYSLWAFDSIWSDYSIYKGQSNSIEGSSSLIYTMNIYVSNEKSYYTRHYAKIQSVFALIGVFERVCYVFATVVIGYFTSIMKQSFFFQHYFDYDIVSNHNKIMNNNYTNVRKSVKGDTKITQNISSMPMFSNLNISHESPQKKDSVIFISSPEKKTVNLVNVQTSKDMILFSFKSLLRIKWNKMTKRLCFNSHKSDVDLDDQFKLYNKASSILKKRLDVMEYLRTQDDIKILCHILLNQFQRQALNFRCKTNLSSDPLIDEELKGINESKKNEMIKYFIHSLNHNEINSIDNIIYNSLQKEIKFLIYEKKSPQKE